MRDLGSEVRPPLRGKPVESHATILVAHAPLGVDEIALFQAVQRLVNRTVMDVETATRALFEPFENFESVHLAPGQRLEDEHIEVALEDGHDVGHRRRSTKSLR